MLLNTEPEKLLIYPQMFVMQQVILHDINTLAKVHRAWWYGHFTLCLSALASMHGLSREFTVLSLEQITHKFL